VRELWSLVRGAAFWVAALLPLSYLPMLHSLSLTLGGFTKLAVLNVVALVVGHGYGSDEEANGDGSADVATPGTGGGTEAGEVGGPSPADDD